MKEIGSFQSSCFSPFPFHCFPGIGPLLHSDKAVLSRVILLLEIVTFFPCLPKRTKVMRIPAAVDFE
jgi:hypothetical protein